jgi:DNA-binding transcriptional ArsR family regulator
MTDLATVQIVKLEKKATLAAKALKSLSNKWRLMILCQLVKGEKSVGEIQDVLDLSQSALSQHLAVLRTSGMVTTRRESQSIFYSIKGSEVTVILAALYDAFCSPAAAPRKAGRAKAKA